SKIIHEGIGVEAAQRLRLIPALIDQVIVCLDSSSEGLRFENVALERIGADNGNSVGAKCVNQSYICLQESVDLSSGCAATNVIPTTETVYDKDAILAFIFTFNVIGKSVHHLCECFARY